MNVKGYIRVGNHDQLDRKTLIEMVESLTAERDKYKRFHDAFKELRKAMDLLPTEQGMVKYSYISSMLDGYEEGFAQSALKEE